MILLDVIGPILKLARNKPEYRYALQNDCRVRFYSEFTFNRRRWKVFEINPGKRRFQMPRASMTFTEAVLDKYGLEDSRTIAQPSRRDLWFYSPPNSGTRNTILDLDSTSTLEIDGYRYTVFEFEVFDTKFVMFN